MAATDIRENLSRIYRWLGFCIEYYEGKEEDDPNRKLADQMRNEPNAPLDALVQMRMSHMTYMMKFDLTTGVDVPRVLRKDLTKMMDKFAPIENNDWWPVWIEYLDTMTDPHWNQMWMDVDETIKDMLTHP